MQMTPRRLRFQRFLKPIFRAVFRLCARVRVKGLEHLPACPPYILFANHISWFDPLLIGSFIPVPIHIMAMKGLFAFPPLAFLMRLVGAFPVRRGSLDRSAIEDAITILARGGVLFIFPEGGIRRMERGGEMRPGISLIAQRSNAPLVPIGISGCRALYNPMKLIIRRVQIFLHIGRPFLISSFSSLTGKKMRSAAMERIEKELSSLANGEPLLS